MLDPNNPPEVIQTRHKYYTFSPLPTEEELQEYYSNKYYQNGLGSYATSYSEEEVQYFELKAGMVYLKASDYVDLEGPKKILDIGCGEGWLLNTFHKHGHQVTGIDFSRYGLEKFHPHLVDRLEQGDVYKILNKKIAVEDRYDIIILANVIEHVRDPKKLLQNIRAIMDPAALLILVVPNDFSPLQEHLLEKAIVKSRYWLYYPDHLAYFNKESMENLLADLGYVLFTVVGDNPIDLNLLNANSNYVLDEGKGKNTHLFRIRTDNFLGGIDEKKLIKIYEILGSMGVGRDLNYYCSASCSAPAMP